MRRGRLVVVLLLVVAAALVLVTPRFAPRTLYTGGPIVTMDPANRIVEALLTHGDRIVAVGDEEALRRIAGRSVHEIDLAGRALLPGFIDAHSHFPAAGLRLFTVDLRSPPLGSVRTVDELVARLAEHAATTDPGWWVFGLSYDDTLLAERRHPTRHDLDRASSTHPIVIVHSSGHLAVANSAALDALELTAASPDPVGGVLRRDPETGALTGVLEETAVEAILTEHLLPSAWDAVRMVRDASRTYAAAGVTTAQVGYATAEQLDGLTLMSRLGLVPMRLVLWPDPETADAILDGTRTFASYDETWVRLGAVKLLADGSIQGYTGYLREPYHVPPGADPAYRGYPRMPAEDLRTQVLRYHRAGWQVAVHGNGDAAIDLVLDAIEAAQAAHPRPDARPVIVHAQMARDDQLDRMQRLGVIPSFFVLHTYYWGDRHRAIFMGPERAARMSPTRSAAERGIRFTIHTDTPVVPMEPLRLVWAAVNRRSTSGAMVGAAQRLAPMEALRAVTIDAAHQHFQNGDRGSLEPGKLADLVILSTSPLDQPMAIDEIRVEQTIVGGKTIFKRQ